MVKLYSNPCSLLYKDLLQLHAAQYNKFQQTVRGDCYDAEIEPLLQLPELEGFYNESTSSYGHPLFYIKGSGLLAIKTLSENS